MGLGLRSGFRGLPRAQGKPYGLDLGSGLGFRV